MNYTQFLKTAATGLLLFKGDTWLDNSIQWGSDSPYSHTMLVLVDGEVADKNITLCQSTTPKVGCMDVHDFWYDYDCPNSIADSKHTKIGCYDQIDYYRDPVVTPDQALRYKTVAESQIGVRYNLVGLIGTGLYRAALYHLFGIKSPAIEPDPKKGLTCSGYARWVWKHAGHELLKEDLNIGMATPGSVCQDMTYVDHLDTTAVKSNSSTAVSSEVTDVCGQLSHVVAYNKGANMSFFFDACHRHIDHSKSSVSEHVVQNSDEQVNQAAKGLLCYLHYGFQGFLQAMSKGALGLNDTRSMIDQITHQAYRHLSKAPSISTSSVFRC